MNFPTFKGSACSCANYFPRKFECEPLKAPLQSPRKVVESKGPSSRVIS
jgi:hypothetical protein